MIINTKKGQIDTVKLQDYLKESARAGRLTQSGEVVGCIIPVADVDIDVTIATIIREKASKTFTSGQTTKAGLFGRAGESLDKTMSKLSGHVADIFECDAGTEKVTMLLAYGEALNECNELTPLRQVLTSEYLSEDEIGKYIKGFHSVDPYSTQLWIKNFQLLVGMTNQREEYRHEVLKRLLDQGMQNLTQNNNTRDCFDASVLMAKPYEVLAVNIIKLVEKGTDLKENLFTGECNLLTVEVLSIDYTGRVTLLKAYQHVGTQGPIKIDSDIQSMQALGLRDYIPGYDGGLPFINDTYSGGDCIIDLDSLGMNFEDRLLSLRVKSGESLSSSFKAKYV